MRNRFTLLLAVPCFFCHHASAQDANIVWRIGAADKDYHDLSFNAEQDTYPRRFPQDVNFVVGQSNPAKDFSGIHPGPRDAWAGGREHSFKITFNLGAPPSSSCC